MSILRITLRTATIAVTAVALTGCISVFPKTKPSGLYRFGHAPVESARPATACRAASDRRRRARYRHSVS